MGLDKRSVQALTLCTSKVWVSTKATSHGEPQLGTRHDQVTSACRAGAKQWAKHMTHQAQTTEDTGNGAAEQYSGENADGISDHGTERNGCQAQSEIRTPGTTLALARYRHSSIKYRPHHPSVDFDTTIDTRMVDNAQCYMLDIGGPRQSHRYAQGGQCAAEHGRHRNLLLHSTRPALDATTSTCDGCRCSKRGLGVRLS